MDGSLLNWVRILALKSVEKPTYEELFDSICRNYSEKFHTPLHQVYDLDPVFVIKQFYASRLSDLYFSHEEQDKLQYEKLREQILTKPNEVAKGEDSIDDDDWQKQLEEEIKQSAAQVAENIKKAVSKLPEEGESTNLIGSLPEEFNMPDFGSFGD